MKKTLAVLLAVGALTLASASPAFATEGGGGGHTPVTICHATASDTNPYNTITVDDDSTKLEGHLAHEDDLFLNANAECPGPAVPPEVVVPPVEPPVVVVPPVEPPVVVAPPAGPPVISDPPPSVLILCGPDMEVSNESCEPADLACPDKDAECLPMNTPPTTPAPSTPPVVESPPLEAVLIPAEPTVAAAPVLAETGFNGGVLAAGGLALLVGGGLLLRRNVV